MRMSPARRLAHVIAHGELEGREWDWASGRFKPPKA
jgi:hypothetical protein